jgi:hypothetical protein
MIDPKFHVGELAVVCTRVDKTYVQCNVTATPKDVLTRGANGKMVRPGWYEVKIGTKFFQVEEAQLHKLPEDEGRQLASWADCAWQPKLKPKPMAPKRQIDLYPLPNLRNKP